jgi:FdhD protein
MAARRFQSILAQRFTQRGNANDGRRPEIVIAEEPLEIRLNEQLAATTMRTPGHDFELAVGWCWAEGLLKEKPSDIRYCATGPAVETEFNTVTVQSASANEVTPRLATVSSSCGICGAEQIENLTKRLSPLQPTVEWNPNLVLPVIENVRAHQELFEKTGGVHAAAAFTSTGEIVVTREDIGRHNAVDKVVGHLLLQDAMQAGLGLFVSGRTSFEIVQKAWAAGFEFIVAVSAPSSLAVETAEAANISLAGFVRDDSFNLYVKGSR